MGENIRDRLTRFNARQDNSIVLHAVPGHFATSQSHINYYIDMTSLKSRSREAREVARFLQSASMHRIDMVDTIVCMDGTEVIGAFLAEELEKNHISIANMHETIYVVSPETNSANQFLFRENTRPAVAGQHVLLLMASITTGETARRSLECIEYYGGIVEGVTAIFSTKSQVGGKQVFSVFTQEDLPGYQAYAPYECPYCKKGKPLEAIVNGFGYSLL